MIVSANRPMERYIAGRYKPDSFLKKPFEVDQLLWVIEDPL